ncbi:unnamed protein product [Microthlaspi erraticum]|uniref:Jacalin-type lectin domain-containing protein n=1 Tax=Microthlaspi erraticum TaxID=1685480 RepID=A0A6D2HX76_9BRAS|nr:unnamed protein product [Microthlaspi erraticum]
MTAQRLEAVGVKNANNGNEWDDGFDHDDVTKIYVEGGLRGIQCIKFDYVKTEKPTRSSHGCSRQGFTQMLEIDHLQNEHLESVEGYNSSYGVQALQFRTNLRVSEMMGYEDGEKFKLAVDGKKIIGFHGSARMNVDALGAYFTEILPTRMEPKGGKGGDEWNDGAESADHEGVTKVHVRCGYEGVQNIRFDYVNKDGHTHEGNRHGSAPDPGFDLEPFEINHLGKEYLLSVDGYYDETSGLIQTLQFKTNLKISKMMGNGNRGTKFSLGCNGLRIIWFHGYAKEQLNSLGAYLTTLPLTKLEHIGNPNSGGHWDDGTFQGVRKVSVHYDDYIKSISFEYENEGKVETRDHGLKAEPIGKDAEFVVDYPNEYVTSIEGKFSENSGYTFIKSLTIKTSKERTSPTLGNAVGDNLVDFVLESKGCALVGFYGWCNYGSRVYSLGAYSYPMPFVQDPAKLKAQDDDEGASSDNGG